MYIIVCIQAAALADEPLEMNYIKKHTLKMTSDGLERPFSRLFSNAPGDFGSMVNEQIGSGDWQDSSELGDTWQKRNSYSYGRTGERGASREGVLKQLLNTTDRIVQVHIIPTLRHVLYTTLSSSQRI